MRWSDFIDFISVERGREDRLLSVAHEDAFLYHSQRPATEARLIGADFARKLAYDGQQQLLFIVVILKRE